MSGPHQPAAVPFDEATRAALDAYVPPLRGLGRIGLLGGSFNPPHLGHVLMATAAYATEDIDHLWVVPCADHAFGKVLAPFADRLRMCHIAFRHFAGGVAVIDIEGRLPRPAGTPSYTVDTLRALHALRPGIRPLLICGSDVVSEMPRWKEPDAVAALAQLVVMPRSGFGPGSRIQTPLPFLSSSEIRDDLAADRRVDGKVDREVLGYVQHRELYGALGSDLDELPP